MKLLDLLITAIALSMMRLPCLIGKGLSVKRLKASHCALITVGVFRRFRPLMPPLLASSGHSFASYFQKFDHWTPAWLARAHRREHAA